MILKFEIKQHQKSTRFFIQRVDVMDDKNPNVYNKIENLTIAQLQKLKYVLDKFLEEQISE